MNPEPQSQRLSTLLGLMWYNILPGLDFTLRHHIHWSRISYSVWPQRGSKPILCCRCSPGGPLQSFGTPFPTAVTAMTTGTQLLGQTRPSLAVEGRSDGTSLCQLGPLPPIRIHLPEKEWTGPRRWGFAPCRQVNKTPWSTLSKADK